MVASSDDRRPSNNQNFDIKLTAKSAKIEKLSVNVQKYTKFSLRQKLSRFSSRRTKTGGNLMKFHIPIENPDEIIPRLGKQEQQ
jgi:hypothetical protein